MTVEVLIWAFLPEEHARTCINQSKTKCAPRQHASSGCTDARDSLGKNVSKEVCFGCEGKITLFSFPKNPVLRKQWMQFVFPGQQRSFSSVFVDERL